MNKEEFRKYVIAEAKKYLFSTENAKSVESPKTIQETVKVKPTTCNITPSEIKKLAEEMKQINKIIDLRNPLISESEESLVESIINKNKPSKGTPLNLDEINKKKHINHQNEGEKDKWNRMLGYNIPSDEERS